MNYKVLILALSKILESVQGLVTVRQVFYQLVSHWSLPNKRSSYNYLSKQLKKARQRGEVDPDKFADRSRRLWPPAPMWNSPEEYATDLQEYFPAYRKDFWLHQPRLVELWVEKDALASVVALTARVYRVTVFPLRGYVSETMLREAAKRWGSRPVTIILLTDHDASGLDIPRDLEKRLTELGANAIINRVGLTMAQVMRFNLPPNPVKDEDTRSPDYISKYGHQCWELDALPPDELHRLLELAIEEEIDSERWQTSQQIEERETTQLEPWRIQLESLLSRSAVYHSWSIGSQES